jgi:protein-S-isoprenylcysteine O-methyltransferase Ste14
MLRHLLAIALLPVVATVVVPILIVGDADIGWGLPSGVAVLPVVLGTGLIAIGLLLMVRTVTLFARVGRGTLAPWDPTSHLVVLGPYRYVRNPMISGVLFILLGEAACFASLPLLIWFAAVFGVNAVYLPLVEERGLRRRFGADYEAYRANVPRWIPRLRPWTNEEMTR